MTTKTLEEKLWSTQTIPVPTPQASNGNGHTGEVPVQIDIYEAMNDLLNRGLIGCMIQSKSLQFGVKRFFKLDASWYECALEGTDDVRVVIKKGTPMIIYPL